MSEQVKEVVWVRHATSVTNRDSIYQAGPQFEIDPLDERGEWESDQLEHRFQNEGFSPDIIVSTSYLRGTQTARKIARATMANAVVPIYGNNKIIDVPIDNVTSDSGKSLFRELDLPSELEGMSFDDEVALAIKEQVNAHRYEPNWHYSDEENFYDVWIRAKECLAYLKERGEQHIVVVSHGGLIKACLARMLFDDEREFSTPEKLEAYHAFAEHTWFDNTGIVSTRLDTDSGKWQWLISANDHLSGPFGYVRKEQSDTSADKLLNRE